MNINRTMWNLIVKTYLAGLALLFMTACLNSEGLTKQHTPTIVAFTATPYISATSTDAVQLGVISYSSLRKRWLNGDPCLPPCWEGIIPGITTLNEAAKVLSSSDLFTEIDLRGSSVEWKTQILYEDNSIHIWTGDALASDTSGIIYAIRIGIPAVRLGDIIQSFGEPDYIVVFEEPPPDIGGQYFWTVETIWSFQGFALASSEKVKPLIDDTLEFRSATYFIPNLEGFGNATNLSRLQYVQEWRGYAEFDDYLTLSNDTP